MLKKNKWTLIISSLLILSPMILGGFFGENMALPGVSETLFTVWLPLIMLAVQWFCILFTLKDPKNREQSPKIVSLVLWIVPVISVLACGITYLASLGLATQTIRILPLLLGLLFAVIGNFMPKCKQNTTIGIKVKWTLQNQENWNATHRFAGKVWVFGGILLMSMVFLPGAWLMAGLMICMFGLAFAPMIYSYCYYRKQKAAGVEITPLETTKGQKKMMAGSLCLVGAILVGVAVVMFTGKVEVTCGEESLTIAATYWEDVTIRYGDITRMEFREEVPGDRIAGFGSARLQLGSFSNEEFGTYARYTQNGGKPCIVLEVNGEIVVFSGANAERTQAIYKTLLEKGVTE